MTTATQQQQKRTTVPPIVNSLVRWILRSPFHGIISRNIMLLTVTGRKSGRLYAIPVSYVRQGDMVLCTTQGNWWKNLRDRAEVTVRLQGRDMPGFAKAIYADREAIARGIEAMLTHIPGDARYYQVRLDADKRPRPEDVARAAERRVLIQVQL
ncbi:MAG: nitroreductase/quinone reductase family protein [Anaerolineae bacterium]